MNHQVHTGSPTDFNGEVPQYAVLRRGFVYSIYKSSCWKRDVENHNMKR